MSGSRRSRWSTAVAVLSAAALVGSMLVAVRRDGAAREAITDADSLRREVQAAREVLNRELRRADSLSSRQRIVEVAGRMGLRPAEDGEVRFLPATGPDTAELPTDRSEP